MARTQTFLLISHTKAPTRWPAIFTGQIEDRTKVFHQTSSGTSRDATDEITALVESLEGRTRGRRLSRRLGGTQHHEQGAAAEIQIKNCFTGSVIFTAESTQRMAIAIRSNSALLSVLPSKARADLACREPRRRASLAGANLRRGPPRANLAPREPRRREPRRRRPRTREPRRRGPRTRNLAGANLAGANLAGANLAGANLAGADLARNLAGARTSQARTSQAQTSRARTSQARRCTTAIAQTGYCRKATIGWKNLREGSVLKFAFQPTRNGLMRSVASAVLVRRFWKAKDQAATITARPSTNPAMSAAMNGMKTGRKKCAEGSFLHHARRSGGVLMNPKPIRPLAYPAGCGCDDGRD